MKKNIKGSEKPIEIFVALFVILAVSMVLLRMFSGQIADKGAQLEDFSNREAAGALCNEVCSNAKTNGCRTEDLIRYCTKSFILDFNQDSTIGVNEEFGFSMCEDKIYCPLSSNCVCGKKLDMKTCIDITKTYYLNNGKNESEIDILLNNMYIYSDGACENEEGLEPWTKFFGITD